MCRGAVYAKFQQKCAVTIQRVWRGHSSRSNLYAILSDGNGLAFADSAQDMDEAAAAAAKLAARASARDESAAASDPMTPTSQLMPPPVVASSAQLLGHADAFHRPSAFDDLHPEAAASSVFVASPVPPIAAAAAVTVIHESASFARHVSSAEMSAFSAAGNRSVPQPDSLLLCLLLVAHSLLQRQSRAVQRHGGRFSRQSVRCTYRRFPVSRL
jgi:hypothetical protein